MSFASGGDVAGAIVRVLLPALLVSLPGGAALDGGTVSAAVQQQSIGDRINSYLARHESTYVELRRDLHRNPEVSGNEVRTARIVAERMRAAGLEVRTGVGGHGVVAILRGARPGPLVAYRADMDAVQSTDPDPVDFKSVVPGVRHICGHDVHTTIGVALASALASVRSELSGSVMFIFQPAEERATGARAMLDDGIFLRERPVAIYGVHTAPLETGQFGTRAGGMMAARDFVSIEVKGSGNVLTAAGRVRGVLNSLSTITPEQRFAPAPDSVVFVELMADQHGLNTTTVRGWITLASQQSRTRVRGAISRLLGVSLDPGVSMSQTYDAARIAGVTNDSALTARAVSVLRRSQGDSSVRILTNVVPAFSEDFGSFQEQVPGVFFFLGVSNSARGWVGMPHSPGYVADERSIVIGARAMSTVLLDRLAAAP